MSVSKDDVPLQTVAEEGVISIDQDMLLQALATTDIASPDLQSPTAVSEARVAKMPYDHSKNLDVIAQLLDNDYGTIDDDLADTSSKQNSLSAKTKTSKHGVDSSSTSSLTSTASTGSDSTTSDSADSVSLTPTSSHTLSTRASLVPVNTSHTKTSEISIITELDGSVIQETHASSKSQQQQPVTEHEIDIIIVIDRRV
ncbi:hypothetical protein FB645_004415 [Coemansia sp. IMI 203386]|nr:hypothetical protein FB645_004415 [Coemansia sp. IMI 203386]